MKPWYVGNYNVIVSRLQNTQFELLDNAEEKFAIRESGELILKEPLDYETKQIYSFRIVASDGNQVSVLTKV